MELPLEEDALSARLGRNRGETVIGGGALYGTTTGSTVAVGGQNVPHWLIPLRGFFSSISCLSLFILSSNFVLLPFVAILI